MTEKDCIIFHVFCITFITHTRSTLIIKMILATSLIFLLKIMLELTYKWKKNHDKKKKTISDYIDISATKKEAETISNILVLDLFAL